MNPVEFADTPRLSTELCRRMGAHVNHNRIISTFSDTLLRINVPVTRVTSDTLSPGPGGARNQISDYRYPTRWVGGY